MRWCRCRSVAFALLLAVTGAGSLATPGRAHELDAPAWLPSWHVAYGGFRQLDDFAAFADGTGWGIDVTSVSTPGGTLDQTLFVHYDGTVFRTGRAVDGLRMRAVAVAGTNFAVAVGNSGAIWHFDGQAWRSVPSGSGVDLRDVALVSPTEGWASGPEGTILYWDGVRWVRTLVFYEHQTMSVVAAMVSGEAWCAQNLGDLLHFLDGAWQNESAPHVPEPSDLAFASPKHGMLVGRGAIELREGLWRVAAPASKTFAGVAWDHDVAYAVSPDRLQRFESGSWADVTLPTTPVDLSRVPIRSVRSHPAGALAFAVDGSTVQVQPTGTVYVWPTLGSVNAIDVLGPDLGWAAGSTRTAGFVGLKAGRWQLSQPIEPNVTITDLNLGSPTDGWAVGATSGTNPESRFYRWDGSTWQRFAVDQSMYAEHVQVVAPGDAVASGSGKLLRWNGEAWQPVADAPDDASTGAFWVKEGGASPEGWFGGKGAVFHWHAGVWDRQALPGSSQLVDALSVPTSDEGWALTQTAIFRYQDGQWHKADLPVASGVTFLDLKAPAAGNVWVLTSPSGLLHWNGHAWEHHGLAPFGTRVAPLRLDVLQPDPELPTTEVWLAGDGPGIATYRVERAAGRLFLPTVRRIR